MASAMIDRSDLAGNSRSEPFILFWEPVPLHPRHRVAPLLPLAGRVSTRARGATRADAALMPLRQAPRGGWSWPAKQHGPVCRLCAASCNVAPRSWVPTLDRQQLHEGHLLCHHHIEPAIYIRPHITIRCTVNDIVHCPTGKKGQRRNLHGAEAPSPLSAQRPHPTACVGEMMHDIGEVKRKGLGRSVPLLLLEDRGHAARPISRYGVAGHSRHVDGDDLRSKSPAYKSMCIRDAHLSHACEHRLHKSELQAADAGQRNPDTL